LSKAKIWRINKMAIHPDILFMVADGQSGDFADAASFMNVFIGYDQDEAEEYEDGEELWFYHVFHYFENFEVNEEFRGNGLGHYLAGESLRIAGAMNLPFFIYPANSEKYNQGKNDPERLKKFWMTLQDDMHWNQKFKVAYSKSFEIINGGYEA